jgi:Phosphotransferase enzyme family
VPPVIATDPRRRWTLVGDAGAMLERGADVAIWEGLGRFLARLQVAFAGQEETLLSLGCPDRRLARFLLELEDFVAPPGPPGPPGQLPRRPPDASAELLARLREALPRVRRACAALEAVGIPTTLVHGDLHGGNVAWRDGEPVFFDWTDASLGHPFLDLITLWSDDPAAPPAPHSIRLREVYLEAWADYAPLARLREAFELGLALGALYQTLSYHRIISSIEPSLGAEWSGALPSWLRQGLDRLDRLDLPG